MAQGRGQAWLTYMEGHTQQELESWVWKGHCRDTAKSHLPSQWSRSDETEEEAEKGMRLRLLRPSLTLRRVTCSRCPTSEQKLSGVDVPAELLLHILELLSWYSQMQAGSEGL